MRLILVWLVGFLIFGLIISPFFIFIFLKNKHKKTYFFLSAIFSLLLSIFYSFRGSEIIEGLVSRINSDLYYFFYDANDICNFCIPILFLLYPFIFSKIIYGKITLKRFFISLFFSVLIFVAMFLIFAYILFPMAGSVLLKNI